MLTLSVRDSLLQNLQRLGVSFTRLRAPAVNQEFLRVNKDEDMVRLSKALIDQGYYLVTVIGTDERALIDHSFKLTYIFSHLNRDIFLFLEHPLDVNRPTNPPSASAVKLPPETGVAPKTGGEDPNDPILAMMRDKGYQIDVFYTTLWKPYFQGVTPFEQELIDMLGIWPTGKQVDQGKLEQGRRKDPMIAGYWLHPEVYPPNLYPLRRQQTTSTLRERIDKYQEPKQDNEGLDIQQHFLFPDYAINPSQGEWTLPVGPIHAGIIEPGRFMLRLRGEIIEQVQILLGYTHRGLEQLFQSRKLEDGWRLAEYVTGDASFAHSLAYCQAAEALARQTNRIPLAAQLWRGLFLELERIVNHIGDCAALAHDVGYQPASSALMDLRAHLMSLNQRLTGHRLLREINRPGGVELPNPLRDWSQLNTWLNEKIKKIKLLESGNSEKICRSKKGETEQSDWSKSLQMLINLVCDQFVYWGETLKHYHPFRDRLQWTGVLTGRQAWALGATGVVARASGLLRDVRWQHPTGVYTDDHPKVREILKKGMADPLSFQAEGEFGVFLDEKSPEETTGDALARFLVRVRDEKSPEETAGDALARFLVRVREVRTSQQIIAYILEKKGELQTQETRIHLSLRAVPNWDFGIGYVESWRGDVVYFLMKDKFEQIFRCSIRDPSLLNWPTLQAALEPHVPEVEVSYEKAYKPPPGWVTTSIGDFPLVNKSFNLSYAACDR